MKKIPPSLSHFSAALLFIACIATAATDAAAPPGWETASPREEITPEFSYDPEGGPDRTGSFVIQSAQREGLVRIDDDAALRGWIDEAFAEHPVEAGRYLAGEKKLQGVLVGFVMKKSKGSADARKVNQLLAARAQG